MAKMKDYTAAQVINLHSGKVKLSADQARRRMHCIEGKKDQKAGVFEIVKPIQFKAGEEFGYDGEIPKSLLPMLDAEEESEGAEDGNNTAPSEAAQPE